MVDLPEPRTVRQAPAQGPADTGQIRSEPLPTPGKRARSGADELSLADTRAGASSDTAGQQGTTPATVGEQPDAPAEKNPPVKGVKPRAAASASGVAKPVARSPASASESSAGGGSESIDPNAAQDAATPTPDTPSASPTTAQPELPLAAHESASGGSSESVDPHAAQTVASVTDATSNTSDAPVTSPWWGNGDANPSSLYFDYVRNKQAGHVHTLADFSYAGYRYQAKALPTVTGPAVFNVQDYGARPNSGLYVDAQAQAAVDAAQAVGGGVVYFPPGKYLFAPPGGPAGPILSITSSNIVLRGAGSMPVADGGTELYIDAMRVGNNDSLISFAGNYRGKGGMTRYLVGDVQRETFNLAVTDPSKLKPGDCFQVKFQSLAAVSTWFPDTFIPAAWTHLHTTGIKVEEPHCIKDVDTTTGLLTLTEPVHVDIRQTGKQATLRLIQPIEEVGLESMRISSGWVNIAQPLCHRCSAMDNQGWQAVSMDTVRNGWVHDVVFQDMIQSLLLTRTMATTVSQVRVEGKAGHIGYRSSRGYGNLFIDCVDLVNTHHGPSVLQYDSGTVFLRSAMSYAQSIDAHGDLPVATLYDNCTGGVLRGSGGNMDAMPNHGKALTLWNFQFRGDTEKIYRFWPSDADLQSNKHAQGMTMYAAIVVGLYGDMPVQIDPDTVSFSESTGKPVDPPSLFEAQVQLRKTNDFALPNVTFPCPELPCAEWWDVPATDAGGSSGSSSWWILLAVVGGICALLALLGISICIYKYVRHRRISRSGSGMSSASTGYTASLFPNSSNTPKDITSLFPKSSNTSKDIAGSPSAATLSSPYDYTPTPYDSLTGSSLLAQQSGTRRPAPPPPSRRHNMAPAPSASPAMPTPYAPVNQPTQSSTGFRSSDSTDFESD